MTGYLLDTNFLVALFWPAHEKHEQAIKWFGEHRSKGWATCPMTEAAFVRVVSNPAFSRDAVRPWEALEILEANVAAEDHLFWTEDVPLARAVEFAGVRLAGHQQVMDVYLLGLAAKKGGKFATLEGLVHELAALETPEGRALERVE